MIDLIKFIVSSIVSKPNQVKVEEVKNPQQDFSQLFLSVASQDLGKVIGKKGKIIKAIRDLVRVKAISQGKRVVLTLKED